MRVLVVGSGGREHALAWRLRQEDPSVQIVAAPGNPGIAELATCVSIGATDIDALVAYARQNAVDWTLVGPEAPLAVGIVDAFRAAGLPIFGPSRAAAMLETSKAFSKMLMTDAGVPTARAITCTDLASATKAIEALGMPVVVKASGLAAGKGVIVCQTAAEARSAAAGMLQDHAFGAAGDTILIEEFMEGEELSVFVLTDGERTVTLPSAQDHKRLLDGDRGPNTGGMGAYLPVSVVEQTPGLMRDILDRIVRPTLAAMRARGAPFTGLLYVGVMLTNDGPKVVEFNCRFGDPETEAVLLALSMDERLGDVMFTIARGEPLRSERELVASQSAVTTVLAAPGYPEAARTGGEIRIPTVPAGVIVFHAGTKLRVDGTLITGGGRVMAVTGVAASFEEAQLHSQTFAREITFEGKQFRSDIGWRELDRRAGATRD